jgi:ABC-type uncharacterized transport system permease subunit
MASPTPSFNQFDPSLGTLTSVDFSLNSEILGLSTAAFDATITVDNGVPLNSKTTAGAYNVTFSGLVGAADAAFYSGTGSFPVVLTLNSTSGPGVGWVGNSSELGNFTGLTLTYDYTPLPAALPLFATGLGGLALAAWRSRRKQKRA